MLLPPGSTACREAGLQGGTDGPNRALAKTRNHFAPRFGAAWDVHGNGLTSVRAGVGQFYQRESLQNGLNLGFNPPFNRVLVGSRTLDSTAEPFPDAFATNDGIPQYGLDTSGKMGYNWQWNVSAQHQIVRNTTLEVGYVGSKGLDLLWPFDINQVPAGDANGNGVADRLEFVRAGSSTSTRAALRPYGVFGNASIAILDHAGSTLYHSLQTQLVSRFGHGSQFQASYTFSRTTGNVTLTGGENGVGGASVSVLEDRSLDEGRTATDRPHIFNTSLVLALPQLEGRSSIVKHLLGDWEIGTIVQASSGRALTVTTGAIPGLPNRVSGTGLNANQRPNVVESEACTISGGAPEQWLNPARYTLTGFQLGTFGNARRGDCHGPSFFQTDLAFYKNVKINGRLRGQLRFETFNVFNRTNFIGVSTALSPTSATLNTGRLATATTITAYTPSAGFGQAGATRDARQAQFGFKLTF